jgi:hypothetical protein
MAFMIHITEENLVVQRNKVNTHFPIFVGSDGLEYIRPGGSSGNQFVALASLTFERSKREKTTRERHVYPHRPHDLPVEAKN